MAWGKPIPNHMDGTLQRELRLLLLGTPSTAHDVPMMTLPTGHGDNLDCHTTLLAAIRPADDIRPVLYADTERAYRMHWLSLRFDDTALESTFQQLQAADDSLMTP